MKLFDESISKATRVPYQMKEVAKILLTNKQGGPLAQMTICPGLSSECYTVSTIVVHSAAVFSSVSTCQFLLPFFNMLTNPGALTVCDIVSKYTPVH